MFILRSFIKSLLSALTITLYFVVTAPLFPFLRYFPVRSRKLLMIIIKIVCRIFLLIFNVKVKVERDDSSYPDDQVFVVSNHLSYLDAFVLFAHYPACFITSNEMKETPLLGQVCTLGGCIFIERRDKSNLVNEIKKVARVLEKGLDIVVFPEGTTFNGDQVNRFKRAFFQSPIDAGKKILPIVINVESINGEKFDKKNRDYICWYGETKFLPHYLNLMGQKEIKLQLSFLPLVDTNKEDSSTELANRLQEIISKKYRPPLP